jgi:plasmid stabilization system protein ParE
MMPQLRIEFLSEALEEATESKAWYAARSPQAATRFAQELDQAIEQIADAPNRWPEHLFGTRRYRLRKFHFAPTQTDSPEGSACCSGPP